MVFCLFFFVNMLWGASECSRCVCHICELFFLWVDMRWSRKMRTKRWRRWTHVLFLKLIYFPTLLVYYVLFFSPLSTWCDRLRISCFRKGGLSKEVKDEEKATVPGAPRWKNAGEFLRFVGGWRRYNWKKKKEIDNKGYTACAFLNSAVESHCEGSLQWMRYLFFLPIFLFASLQ